MIFLGCYYDIQQPASCEVFIHWASGNLASPSANLILFFVHFQKYVLIFNPTECCMTENSVPCLPVILNQWINGPTVLNGVSNYPLRVESIPKFYSPCPSEEFDLVGFTVQLLYSLSTRIVKQKPSRLTWNQILFLDASKHLYIPLCLSVRPAVRPSGRPSVRGSGRSS